MGSNIKVGDVVRVRGCDSLYIVESLHNPCGIVHCVVYDPKEDVYDVFCLSKVEKVGV